MHLERRFSVLLVVENSTTMRHIRISPPCIGRRDVRSDSTVLPYHDRTASRSQSPCVSLAGDSARTHKNLSELSRVQRYGANGARRLENSDHANCRCFRQSQRCMLEIRPTGWHQRKAQLSPLDKARTTKTFRPDLISFSRGSNTAAATLVDFCTLDVAPFGGERSHRAGLVYEARFSRSVARTGK